MKKKVLIAVAIVLVLVLALTFASQSRKRYLEETYITIADVQYLRDIDTLKLSAIDEGVTAQLTELANLKQLDLTEAKITIGQYDALRAALPNCEIFWKVPFQGNYLPLDTKSVTVETLSQSDIETLAYLPELEAVDAPACREYEQLDILQATYPDLAISYTVPIDGTDYPHTTTSLTLEAPELTQLEANLRYLPEVTEVTLTEEPQDLDTLMRLKELYPQITFDYTLTVCGVTVTPDVEEIDLSGIPMTDTEELERMVKYLPNLKKVIMIDCGISNEEMEALNNRHDDPLFVWTVQIGPLTYRTDETAFIPVKYHFHMGPVDVKNLRYLTELIALDVGHMHVETCEFIRHMPKLQYLILIDTGIHDISPLEGLKDLIYLELFVNDIDDYSPLLNLTSLEDLNICYTFGDYKIISQMTWLKRLWWTTSRLTEDEIAYIRQCLPNAETNFVTLSSTGEGWRNGENYFKMRDVFGMGYMTK